MATPMEILSGALLTQQAQPQTQQQIPLQNVFSSPGQGAQGTRGGSGGGSGQSPVLSPAIGAIPVPDLFARPQFLIQPEPAPIPGQAAAPQPQPPASTPTSTIDPQVMQQALLLQGIISGSLSNPSSLLPNLLTGFGFNPNQFGSQSPLLPPSALGLGQALQTIQGQLLPEIAGLQGIQSLFGAIPTSAPLGMNSFLGGPDPASLTGALQALALILGGS